MANEARLDKILYGCYGFWHFISRWKANVVQVFPEARLFSTPGWLQLSSIVRTRWQCPLKRLPSSWFLFRNTTIFAHFWAETLWTFCFAFKSQKFAYWKYFLIFWKSDARYYPLYQSPKLCNAREMFQFLFHSQNIMYYGEGRFSYANCHVGLIFCELSRVI